MITVTAALIVKDGKILGARRKHGKHLAGFWEFPGGKLEPHESPRACLKRELKEELCIDTDVKDFLAESIYDYGDFVVKLLAFHVIHVSGKICKKDHDEIRWFGPSELRDVKWAPADVPLLNQANILLDLLLSSRIKSLVSGLCESWGIQEIQSQISVKFSNRMTKSLGRTKPKQKTVLLNSKLRSSLSEHLEETLCHEIAHIAAIHKFGNSIRPHGPEWQSLVKKIGYEPTVRLTVDKLEYDAQISKKYFHTCPVCHSNRLSRSPLKKWRCKECVSNGLEGNLIIEEMK